MADGPDDPPGSDTQPLSQGELDRLREKTQDPDGGEWQSSPTAVLNAKGLKEQLAAMREAGPEPDPSVADTARTDVLTAEQLKEQIAAISDEAIPERAPAAAATPLESPAPEPPPAVSEPGADSGLSFDDDAGGGFDDIATDQITTGGLKKHLDEMKRLRTGEEEADDAIPTQDVPQRIATSEVMPIDDYDDPPLPPAPMAMQHTSSASMGAPLEAAAGFPSAELGRWVSARGTAFGKASVGKKIALVLLVMLVIGGGGAGITWLLVRDTETAFLRDTFSLRSGPTADGPYQALAVLGAGSKVKILSTANDQIVVRDAMGRVGYLPSDAVSFDPVGAHPDRKFADCFTSPLDGGEDPCAQRARAQFESCRLGCEARGQHPTCVEVCQVRLAECVGACQGVPEKPQPELEEPAPVKEEPAAEAVAAPAPEEKPAVKAEPPKKKKKKKRRRKRR